MRRGAWVGGLALTSAVVVTAAICTLVYLWVILGDRGLYADATGTSGYTTPLELGLLIGSLVALPIFGIAGVASMVYLLIRRRDRKAVEV